MADNVQIDEGSTTSIAADDIAGVKHQRVKIQFGADGSATDVSSSNKLPVDTGLTQPTTPTDTQPISAAALPLPTGAATSAKQDTIISNTNPTTSLAVGRKTVTTAGTAEALASPTACKWVAITAETDNTGVVCVGDSSVVASLSTRKGIPLNAGDSIVIPIDNLSDVYLDVTVNGEGVTYLYGN